MGAPVVHWEINARDARRAQEFYSSLFGWTIDANNPMGYGMVSTGSPQGIGGGIGQNDPNQPVPPAVTFYVQVEDPQMVLDKVAGLGGRVVMPVTEIPGMVTFALFADPEGNTIGLLKGAAAEAAPQPKRSAPSRRKAVRKSRTLRGRKPAKAKKRKTRR